MSKSKLVEGRKEPFRCHSTSSTIRSRRLANRCAPCAAASTCRTSIGRPRLSMSRPRVPAKAKPRIAMSLAISAATSGLKVALVDADLRHPSTSRFFKLEQEKGLVDLLLGATAPAERVEVSERSQIDGHTRRQQEPEPTRCAGLGAHAAAYLSPQGDFDYVVLDTPPVGPVVDPVLWRDWLIRPFSSFNGPRRPASWSRPRYSKCQRQKRVAGVVFNGVIQERAKKYGGEYYYGKSYEKYYST